MQPPELLQVLLSSLMTLFEVGKRELGEIGEGKHSGPETKLRRDSEWMV
jgi:hypothetical protein